MQPNIHTIRELINKFNIFNNASVNPNCYLFTQKEHDEIQKEINLLPENPYLTGNRKAICSIVNRHKSVYDMAKMKAEIK